MSTITPQSKPFSLACERNREPILAVLQRYFLDRHQVLEIGSGTGQHAVHFAQALPHLRWQCSDVTDNLPGIQLWLDEAALPNIPAPLTLDVNRDMAQAVGHTQFDAIYSANTLHIMGWAEVEKLFAGLPALLNPGGLLVVYGPFKREGKFSGEGDARFDISLREGDPRRGIRDLEAVHALARAAGLAPVDDRALPANNRCNTWRSK